MVTINAGIPWALVLRGLLDWGERDYVNKAGVGTSFLRGGSSPVCPLSGTNRREQHFEVGKPPRA